METTVAKQTTAAPAAVWRVITDIEGSQDVLSGVTEIERLDDGDEFGVGLRWRETRVLFGKEATEEMEVTAVDEGRSYTVEAHSGGVHYRSVMSVEPDGDGARIRMSFAGEEEGKVGLVGRIVARTAGKAIEKATRKALQQDLDDIAAAAEATDPGADGAAGTGVT